jgi:hypothetical protein
LRNWLIIFFTAAAAANIKFQLVPLVFIVLFFILLRIIWFRWQAMQAGKKTYKWLLTFMPTILLANI